MTETGITIAIDGYAACGKSSTAKAVAHQLGYVYVDTGAMYRAFTLWVLEQGIDLTDAAAVEQALNEVRIELLPPSSERGFAVRLNGRDVSREIRSPSVNGLVSEVSSLRPVRERLVHMQRHLGLQKRVVMDGRDIGTVVFPDAELKVFMTADLEARVARRKLDLEAAGQSIDEDSIRQNLIQRDHQDTHRAESPLRQAPEARVIDTTGLAFGDQVQRILNWAQEIIDRQVQERKMS